MVIWGYNISWRSSNWITNNIIWITAVNIWPNTSSAKFAILYWLYFHRPTKLGGWQWCLSSLHSICHHQKLTADIILLLNIHPIVKDLSGIIKRLIQNQLHKLLYWQMTNWDHLFLNKDVHQQIKILTNILFDVFSNFTPSKVVTFHDRDPL